MNFLETTSQPPRQDAFPAKISQRLATAVIGTGKISEAHLKFLRRCDCADVRAVCDLSPSLAAYACDRFSGGHPYTDYRKMLAEVRPEVVHILTPAHTHNQIIRDCLEAGAHVVAEKPVALSNGEFQALANLARQVNRRLIEDHNYRFNRTILEVERLVARGRLGDVCDVEVRLALGIRESGSRYADSNLPHPSHQLPCGVLHEFITHLCYLLLRFIPDASRMTAAWSNHGGGELFKYDDLDALVMSGSAHGRIRFSARTRPECFTLIVRGTKGWAETDLFQPFLRIVEPRRGGAQLSPLINHVVNGAGLISAGFGGLFNKVLQFTPLHGLETFLDLTYRALLDGSEPPVTLGDMDRVSRLVDSLLAARCWA
jgi:predicted dehydrogenase